MGNVGCHTVHLCLQPALNLKYLLWLRLASGIVPDYFFRRLALDLMPPLPSVPGVLNRWAAEPIRHLFIPASSFIANAKGYPVLPKGSQSFIRDVMKVRECHQNTAMSASLSCVIISPAMFSIGPWPYCQIRMLAYT